MNFFKTISFVLLFVSVSLNAQQVSRVEYFIDTDPDVGKGIFLTFSPADTVEFIFKTDTINLSVGTHLLYIRFCDSSGKWSPYTMQHFLVQDTIKQSNINQAEYFIDTDDQTGKMIPIALNNGEALDTMFKLNNLSLGTHLLYARVNMGNGKWSPYTVQHFLVQDTVKQGNINQAEYFIDTDNQAGKMTSIKLNKGATLDTIFKFDNLSLGTHLLYARVNMGNGKWSPYTVQHFLVQDTVKQGSIHQAEYFIDTDDQAGKMTPIMLNNGASLDTFFKFDNLSLGTHLLYARVNMGNGKWSPYTVQHFLVQDTVKQGSINQAEYFIDTDDQAGKMTSIKLNKGATLDTFFKFDNLSLGTHLLYARVNMGNGKWSPYTVQHFLVQDTIKAFKIKSYRYVIDSGLHKNSFVKQFNFNPSVDSFNMVHLEKMDSMVPLGRHFFRTWVQDEKNKNSTWHFDTLTIIDCPMLDTASIKSKGAYCLNDSLTFNQDITKFGIWAKDSFNFKWYINNSFLSNKDSFIYKANASGIYNLKFEFFKKSNASCKGTLIQNITINPVYNFRDTFTLCNGDSLNIHSKIFKSQGVFTTKFNTINGCDSTWITKININPVYNFRDTFTLCNGDRLNIHSKIFKSQGVFTTKFNTINGCDSTWITKININPVYNFRDTFTLCNGDSLKIHGKIFKSAGTFSSKFNTIKGCDSTWITKININTVYNFRDTFTLCNGDSLNIHSKIFKSQGVFTTKFNTIKGCDSTWITKININPNYNFRDTFTLCNSDSLKIHGKIFKSAGTFSSKFNTIKGCDSTWITKININTVYNFRDTFTLCNGDSLNIHSKIFKSQGVFTTKFNTIKGCDSTWITKININPTYRYTVIRGLCAGDSILFNSKYRNLTGIYIANLKTIKNCDSIVTLNLTVDSKIIVNRILETCLGDSVFIAGGHRKVAGLYTEKQQALKGCDSFTNTTLIINQPKNINLTSKICANDSQFFNGKFLKKTGLYTANLKTFKDCDSIVKLTLTVADSINTKLKLAICQGDSLFTGNTWKKVNGNYIDKLKAKNGCDSFVFTKLKINPNKNTNIFDTICFGSTYNFFGNILNNAGIYSHTLNTFLGCDSIIKLTLFKRSQYIPKVVSIGFTTLSTDTTYKSYQWHLNRTPIFGKTQRTINIEIEGIYDVSVTNKLGCAANSWDNILGVDNINLNNIKIYPNPANKKVNINVTATSNILVYNAVGKTIATLYSIENATAIETINWAEGVYYFIIQNNNHIFTTKIVVEH